ncbi:MAG: nucleotidyltransferase domain-containing protein [Patescibacteria group bacterium]
MEHRTPTRARGLAIAKRMKERLLAENVPVVNVYLFGSLARGKTHRWSDVDIAVVYRPFLPHDIEERLRIRSAREDFDVPMDIVCLHPEDLDNIFLGIAQEVRHHGIPV